MCMGYMEVFGNVSAAFIANVILSRFWIFARGKCRIQVKSLHTGVGLQEFGVRILAPENTYREEGSTGNVFHRRTEV